MKIKIIIDHIEKTYINTDVGIETDTLNTKSLLVNRCLYLSSNS